MSKKNVSQSRRQRAAEITRAQRSAERRRSLVMIGSAVFVALALVGSAVFIVVRDQRRQAAEDAAAARPIDGVQTFEDLTRNHVEQAPDYPQTPPVGGDHDPVWTNCGTYTEAIDDAQTVHSMEHGAVWLTYSPDASQADIDELTSYYSSGSYVLVSPVEGQASPVMATSWGQQLAVDSATDPRVGRFVTKNEQGPDTPEPGAPCTGGQAGM